METVNPSLRCGLASVWLLLAAAGCSTPFAPKSIDEVPFRERAQTQVVDGIRVTAAVPDADESRELFGVPLYKKRIQPVWIEIENRIGAAVRFLPAGVDSDYLTPIEVASLNTNPAARERAERYLYQNGVDLQVAPGQTRSGFVFTNLDEGTKSFNIDVLGEERNWQFTFFVPVPGLAVDHYEVDFKAIYEPDAVTEYTEPEAFIAAIEALPCCTTDTKGKLQGDPLNLVIIGEPGDLYYAFIRAGWDETEVVTTESGLKTAISFLTGGYYRYSPVSALYLFGRKQDVALQRIRENINERNHFRLWLAPMTFKGRPVWIGQISRDIGVRFTTKTITTHKIDPDVDETREFLLENLAYHQVLERFGYVGGVGEAPFDAPRANLTGDPYFTDGLRIVLWIPREPVGLEDIRYVDWARPGWRAPSAR